MSAATQPPALRAAGDDDPGMPGRYITNGQRLFRLLGPGAIRNDYLEIEDCMTLEVWLVDSRELRSWDVTAVCNRLVAVAA